MSSIFNFIFPTQPETATERSESRYLVFHETKLACENPNSPEIYRKTSVSELLDLKTLYSVNNTSRFESMEVLVVNEDTLIVAEACVREGFNTVILNMTSATNAGSGINRIYERIPLVQEEELFRRTNYSLSLDNTFYPLQNSSVIYNSTIVAIKDINYNVLAEPFELSAIAACGVPRPILLYAQLQKHDFNQYIVTIDNIFKAAYLKNHEVLILGALGCGAYQCPPEDVAVIFNMCLVKYWNCFKKVIFAVHSVEKDDRNFEVFDSFIIRSKDGDVNRSLDTVKEVTIGNVTDNTGGFEYEQVNGQVIEMNSQV